MRDIIASYVVRDYAEFAEARHGFALDADEQRQRYLLQSVLVADGLAISQYVQRFGTDPRDDFPPLTGLADAGFLKYDLTHWRPTASGLEWSDAIGPYLFSREVNKLMGGTSRNESFHPLPRPTFELQLRLQLLPVYQP